MKSVLKAFVASLVVLTVGASAFLGGVYFQRVADTGVPVPSVPGLAAPKSDVGSLVDQVKGLIQKEALEPSSDTTITTKAIEGALASLDDTYAAYFDPKQYGEFQMDSKGEFYGIGVTIGLSKDNQPVVNTVFDGTPAKKAGLKAGDIFASIDGLTRKKWDLDEVVSHVRGPIGTKVKLQIKRGKDAPFTVSITRDRIVVPNTMKKTFPGKVGYVRLMSFNERAAADLGDAIREFDKKGMRGYILDLRGNPGGLLTSAVQVCSLFVEDGVIVRVDERGKPEEENRAIGGAITSKPLVVLIDFHSASASEIVAGALQDYKRAVIVGETSYGKGSVQTVRKLDNGGAIKFTIAHYLTPKKRVINKKGVVPDVVVKMDMALQDTPAKDSQLQAALSVLRGKF
ncbi:MAG: S41 family peptidase [Actinomycetota bacterium]|nr:S41 family peptidase [Actinomycetota bacterium]